MEQFIAKYQDLMQGTLCGFDRVVFRGMLRKLMFAGGMEEYLWKNGVLFKDYQNFAKRISERIKKASLAAFQRRKLPVVFVRSAREDKERIARQIAGERKIRSGPVCALSCLEPSPTFEHYGRQMVARVRPCLVLYHYYIDPKWGWTNARIQTWFPWHIQVCINGREWLACQMDREKLRYVRVDNCFAWVQDYERAQALLDQQRQTAWVERLERIAQQLNPLREELLQKYPSDYYWTCYQSEYALDVIFQPGQLQRLEPLFLQHGLLSFSSADVLRFLGHAVPPSGKIPARLQRRVSSDWKRRQEGARIKHRVGGNSLKAYGKAQTPAGDVFRVETTINQVDPFRVYRPEEGWKPMRKGIADLERRAEVSEKACQRYLDAFSHLDDSTLLEELLAPLDQPQLWKGRRVRPLHPFQAQDYRLLKSIHRGEFLLNGFRNRDLQTLLYDTPAQSKAESRRRSAAISRQLRILRAHKLIHKISHTHRYQITSAGHRIILAVLTAQRVTLKQLNLVLAA